MVRQAAVTVLLSGLASGLAHSAPINMPGGSALWIEMDSNACDPDGDSDCLGSNQFGANPGGGIAPVTFIDGTTHASGAAEAYPDLMRSYISANTGTFMYMSMLDTYTVHGTANGTFQVTAHFGASGTASSLNNFLLGATVRVEIGTFNTSTGNLSEQFRVQPFTAANTALQSISNQVATVTVPLNVATSYTRSVGVGDVFSLAFGLTSSVATGTIDLRNTALISFDLPEGVYITAANGATFGTVPAVPVPAAVWLFGSALGVLGVLKRRDR